MRIAIVGSRVFPNLDLVRQLVQQLPEDTVVVSGGARGVDQAAEKAARDRGLEVMIFPADWDKHGKVAGILRNRQIVEYSDAVIAFWDGESRGTKNTIDIAEKLGVETRIFTPKSREVH